MAKGFQVVNWQALLGLDHQLILIKLSLVELWPMPFHIEFGFVVNQLELVLKYSDLCSLNYILSLPTTWLPPGSHHWCQPQTWFVVVMQCGVFLGGHSPSWDIEGSKQLPNYQLASDQLELFPLLRGAVKVRGKALGTAAALWLTWLAVHSALCLPVYMNGRFALQRSSIWCCSSAVQMGLETFPNADGREPPAPIVHRKSNQVVDT